MIGRIEHLRARTYHGRKGGPPNAFRYSVDYVLLDAENDTAAPALFSRNRGNVASVSDKDHGGPPGAGSGAQWVRSVLADYQIPQPARINLLAQPRLLGHVFNPVSFWLCENGDGVVFAVIAEVTNTYGQRHSYLCHTPDLTPIRATDRLLAQKVLHVSPFQPVQGSYAFRFDIRADRIGIRIDLDRDGGGLVATLAGTRQPMTSMSIIAALLRRPFGSRRVLALIHWQALRLWWKGARFRSCPEAPKSEVSRG